MPKQGSSKYTDAQFIEAVKCSKSTHEVLKKLGLNPFGAAYKIFKRKCMSLQLDLSHFQNDRVIRNSLSDESIINVCKSKLSRQSTLAELRLNPLNRTNLVWINKKILELRIDINHWTGQGHLKGKTHNWNYITPLKDVLVENKCYSNKDLKKRLFKEQLLENKCYQCGITSWQDKPISLHLEHKNGNHLDNRIENLTILCPNCHSQTPTFCRAKSSFKEKVQDKKITIKQYQSIVANICSCGKNISKLAKNCRFCVPKKHKIIWPPIDDLIKMIEDSNYLSVGKLLNVSDNAVRKHIKRMGYQLP